MVTYDSDKHVSMKVTDTFKFIGETVYPVKQTTTYEYNVGYFPTKLTEVTVIEALSSTTTKTFTYVYGDDENHLANSVVHSDAQGSVDVKVTNTWSDDEHLTIETDANGDGQADQITTAFKYWFPFFFPPMLTETVDGNADGTVDYTYTNTFNDDDFIATIVVHDENNDVGINTITVSYDDSHNMTKQVAVSPLGTSTSTFSGFCYE